MEDKVLKKQDSVDLEGLDLENWRCPILGTVFVDPVVASDGHTYERAAIEEWFRISSETDVCLSPMTGFPLESRILLRNHAIRNTIEDATKSHPFLKNELTQIEDVEALTGRKFNELNCAPATGDLIDFDSFDEAQVERNLTTTAKVAPRAESDVSGLPEVFSTEKRELDVSFVSLSSRGNVRKWNFASNTERNTLTCKDVKALFPAGYNTKGVSDFETTTCITTTSAGFVVSGERNGNLNVWQWTSNGNLEMIDTAGTLQGHLDGGVCSIASWPSLNAKGPLLVSGARDKTIRIWEPENEYMAESFQGLDYLKSWIWRCNSKLTGHKDFVNCVDVEIESGSIISGSADWSIKLWDVLTFQEVGHYDAHSYAVRCLAWASSGDLKLKRSMAVGDSTESLGGRQSGVFCSGGDDEMIYIWDTRQKYSNRIARLNAGATVLCCCWGASGEFGGELPWLAAGGGTPSDSFNASSENLRGWLRVYDPRMWKAIGDCTSKNVDRERRAEADSCKEREAHWCCVNSCLPVYLPGGRCGIVSSGRDAMVRVWRLPLGPGGLSSPTLDCSVECSEGNQKIELIV